LLVSWLGRVPYDEAWGLQRRLAAARAAGAQPDTLLLLEHPHVYTLGRSGHAEHVVWDAAERARRGVELVWVDRGGDVTYHGPGQLVGYPIVQLGDPGPDGRVARADFVGYVRDLESTLIQAVAEYGVAAGRWRGRAGVWVWPAGGGPPEKLAAIGVRVDARGVASHGFALNVDPELDYFNGIVPCGIRDGGVTSIARLTGHALQAADAVPAAVAAFAAVFAREVAFVPPASLDRAASEPAAPAAPADRV
jgi:lipoate-protein ligase B